MIVAGAVALAGPWSRSSAAALVAANLIPIGGVLLAGWQILPLMLLFWLENLIIGLFTVCKMFACGKGGLAEKVFTVPFFLFHYGMFCTAHGAILISLFGPDGDSMRDMGGILPHPAFLGGIVEQQGLWIAVVALVLSHGFSFIFNFLGRGEYRSAEVRMVMIAPYGRIIVLHVVIILGGFLAMALGTPLWALAMLVILKIVLDLKAHIREHRAASDVALTADGSVAGP